MEPSFTSSSSLTNRSGRKRIRTRKRRTSFSPSEITSAQEKVKEIEIQEEMAEEETKKLITKLNSSRRQRYSRLSPLLLLGSLVVVFFVGVANTQFAGVGFEGMCPVPECYCGLDMRGRLEVHCSSGGMNEVPTSRMSPSIEVIRITSPKGRYNHLTIGRSFRQFKKLQELHIVNSNIPNIGEDNFRGVVSLRLLNLTRNNINQLVDFNFRGLANLDTLSLSENHIDTMDSECFKNLTKLKTLDLSRNRISRLVERQFYNLHMLEVLDLSDNRLRELNADVFRDIWRLREFRCQRCQLRAIPSLWYSLLPALRRLDLKYNDLKRLNEGEFSALKSIEEIYLDGNKITVLSEDAFRLTRVRTLSLAYNGIIELNKGSFVNASVETLDLSGNKFESINKLIFLDLKRNLTKLDLSRNPRLKLSSLLIILSENTRLRWLSVARNNYEDLPLDLFEDNKSLQYLNLSNNRLRELFPRQFSPLGNLQILDLSYNRLLGIDAEVLNVFDRINSIREIRLEGNPWACDLCHIPPLHKWIQTSPIFKRGCTTPNGPFCLRCRYPSDQYDKAIIHLQEETLEWCDPYGGDYGDESRLGLFLGGGLLFLILILVVAGILLRYQFWHSAHYYTNEETRVDTGLTPPPYDDELFEGSQQYYATINGTHTKIISTIDEKNFNPDANFYPDLTTNLNMNPLYRGAALQSPSVASKSDHSPLR